MTKNSSFSKLSEDIAKDRDLHLFDSQVSATQDSIVALQRLQQLQKELKSSGEMAAKKSDEARDQVLRSSFLVYERTLIHGYEQLLRKAYSTSMNSHGLQFTHSFLPPSM